MSRSAIPACLAVASWHTVIIGDSLPTLTICPFFPTLINSKLSAYYAPYLLLCWCHFCMSSHKTVTCVISCQQKKQNIVTLLSFYPLLIFYRFSKCDKWNLTLSVCAASVSFGVGLLSILSISFPQSLKSFSKPTSQILSAHVSIHL